MSKYGTKEETLLPSKYGTKEEALLPSKYDEESLQQQWLSRVQERQRSHCTPEKIQQIRERARHQASLGSCARKAKRLGKSATLNQKAYFCGMKSAAAVSSRGEKSRDHEVELLTEHMERAQKAMAWKADSECDDEDAAMMEEEEINQLDELESRIDALDCEIVAESGGNVATSHETLLSSLRKEPSNDADCAAKFVLYEKFHETVVIQRKELFGFYDEAKTLFEGVSRQQAEKDMKKIDCSDNLGIADDDGTNTWFVYKMAVKANSNFDLLAKLLESIRTRLDLMDNQKECPVCFEEFDVDERPSNTLACCHKVCKECWENWTKLNQNSCPLCRHENFLEVILGSEL